MPASAPSSGRRPAALLRRRAPPAKRSHQTELVGQEYSKGGSFIAGLSTSNEETKFLPHFVTSAQSRGQRVGPWGLPANISREAITDILPPGWRRGYVPAPRSEEKPCRSRRLAMARTASVLHRCANCPRSISRPTRATFSPTPRGKRGSTIISLSMSTLMSPRRHSGRKSSIAWTAMSTGRWRARSRIAAARRPVSSMPRPACCTRTCSAASRTSSGWRKLFRADTPMRR